ncbi:LPD38 domain-containing protein [Roseibium album]|uniref:LPD38 domain-containing protein n=1 Tax=Roseibium album TaxID=311410 RepID=UPI0024933EA6|nr:LPD38 domain-containing protein [Roseibium album]
MSNIFDQFDDGEALQPGAAPGLGERFQKNFDAGQRQNTILGSVKDASTESRRDDRRRFDEALEAMPEWQGLGEGAVALGGQIAGTAASVENFVPVGLGARILASSKAAVTGLWARVFAGAVDSAAVNAVSDAAIQGIEIEAGHREDFDPVQYGASVLLGAGIGGAGGAVAHGGSKLLKKGEGAPDPKQTPASADAPEPAALAVVPDDVPAAAPERLPTNEMTMPNGGILVLPDVEHRRLYEFGQALADGADPAELRGDIDDVFTKMRGQLINDEAPVNSYDDFAHYARETWADVVDETSDGGRLTVTSSIDPEFQGKYFATNTRGEPQAAPPRLGDDLSAQAIAARGVVSREVSAADSARGSAAAATPEPQSALAKASTAAAEFINSETTGFQSRLAGKERQRPSGGRAAKDKTAEPVARVRETAEALAKALEIPSTRQGRIRGRSQVLGQYNTKTGGVRVRSLDDFDTLSHEYGHHLDNKIPEVKQFIKRNSKALKPLDYDGSKQRDFEGFAEFFRLWITNRPYVEKQLPELAAEFAEVLKKHPDLMKGIDEASDAWSNFMDAPSQVAVAATIVSSKQKGWVASARKEFTDQGIGGTISDVLERVYGFFLDDLNPLQRAVSHLKDLHFENTGKRLDLNVSSDAYKLARVSRGAYSAGHMDVMYGVAPYRGLNPESPSLRDAIIEATGKPNSLSAWDDALVRDFGSYLWSRRAIGEWQRYKAGDIPNAPDKLTEGDHVQNVKDLVKSNPQFEAAADKVYRYNQALWKKKYDAGLIDRATYDEGLAIVDYVPGLRDFSTSKTDEKVPSGKQRQGKDLKNGITRRFKGSKRDVINPLESLAADAYETATTIARNDVFKALHRLSRVAGTGGARIAEEIPVRQLQASMVDPLEAVESAAKNAGLGKMDTMMIRDALESAIGDEKAAIFRPAMISENGEPIVFFRDGGELKALRLADGQFGRDMYGALTSMNQAEKNFWLELVAMPARVLRLGITTSLDFIGANFVRDQAMAAIYYGRPLRRVGRSLQGAADDILGTETARIYSRSYGISGGQETASLSAARAERDISKLKRKGWLAQRLTSFRGVLQTAELAETASRIGLFRTFKDEAKARGLDDYEAALEASWRARDYIDFDRRGSQMAAIARVVPFLNAAMQGLDKTGRHMLMPLARKALGQAGGPEDARAMAEAVKAWARMGVVAAGSASLYALMSDHEDHDEISNYTRSTHWTIKMGEKWLAIPKPFELATVFNLAEATFEAIKLKDPIAFNRWKDNLHFSLMPPSILEGNPAIKSYFEVRTNTNLFTDAPIVPDHLTALEPMLQYTSRTTDFSKQLGEAFNMSPAVIDHLIMNHLASWGRSALSLYDLAQPDAPVPGWDDAPITRRFIKDAAKGSQSVTQFWDLMATQSGKLEGMAKSWQTLGPVERADFYAVQDQIGKAYIALSTHKASVKRLHPLVRSRRAVQAINILRREMSAGTLRGPGGDPQSVSPAARSAADDVLGTLAMAIARNGLKLTGVDGWRQREDIDEDGFYRELEAIDPALLETLGSLYAEKKVWSFAAIEDAWPELQTRLLSEGTEALTVDLVRSVEAEGFAIAGGMKRPKKEKPSLDPAGGH